MAKKSTTTRKKKPAAKKARRAAYETMIIASVVPENPRRKGTKAAKLFDEMAAYVKAHRNVKVSDLIAATGYRVQDLKWDIAHEFITVRAAR
jgi:hypothetical protein